MKKYVFELSIQKGIYNAWSAKLLKGNTRAVKRLYQINKIDRCYRILATSRTRNYTAEAKSNIPKVIKTKLYCNIYNKKIKSSDKFGIKFPNSTRESLIM